MIRFCLYITVLIIIVFMTTGCVTTGLIYTHVTSPLDTNMSQTPSGTNEAEGDIKEITFYNISVLWDSTAIGDIAKANGMETVYYADVESLSVFGIWNQSTVHIYGK